MGKEKELESFCKREKYLKHSRQCQHVCNGVCEECKMQATRMKSTVLSDGNGKKSGDFYNLMNSVSKLEISGTSLAAYLLAAAAKEIT